MIVFGCFRTTWDNLEVSLGRLVPSWCVLGTPWSRLEGVLGRLGSILHESWTCIGKLLKKLEGDHLFVRVFGAKIEAKIFKFMLKKQLFFLTFFNIFFRDFSCF